MDRSEFHNALRILHSIDGYELPGLDQNTVVRFIAAPVNTFIRMGDDNAAKIWDVVKRRQGETQEDKLLRIIKRLVSQIDDIAGDSEGALPMSDAGCFDCTSGTVPNDKNTGPCPYHAARELLAKIEKELNA